MRYLRRIAVFIYLLCVIPTVEAAIWYVHPDSALSSVQTGLNYCATGDTVLVAPGIYYENLIWPNTHGIDLTSDSGAAATTLDGGGSGRVIFMEPSIDIDTTTVIKGFTIQNGYTDHHGGGIFCSWDCTPRITQNIFRYNRSHLGGGGIYCHYDAKAIITDNTIVNNTTDCSGGGIHCYYHASPIIENNIINYNSAAGCGGGIYCYYYIQSNIANNTIIGNSAGQGSGIFCDRSSTNIANNVIGDNWASQKGGGIGCHGSSASIVGNDIFGNASEWAGGGIYCDSSSSVTITNNTISDNTAQFGGGIYCEESSPNIADNIIVNNTASANGGGLCFYDYCSTSVMNNDIASNMADWFGGGIYCHLSSPIFLNDSILNNMAAAGGGIYCQYSSPLIDSCAICNNVGDGLYCMWDSDPLLVRNNITGNSHYGVNNVDPVLIVDAEYNWWGDTSGPYHPVLNPTGLGDSVSDNVNFDPWLYWPVGIFERLIATPPVGKDLMGATVIRGPLVFPEGKTYRVFDIAGRVVEPSKIPRGIYFVQVDNKIVCKVVKVR